MKLHLPTLSLALLLAALPAFAQDEPSSKSTAAIDLVVAGQIRRVVIELNDTAAPQTVANFEKLAKEGFYNGLAVHRAIPRYLVQMGDPYTRDDTQKHLWGTGGPKYSVRSEIGLKNVRGAVVMARMPGGAGSSGSQFFVVLADEIPSLDGKYTVFGRVTRGIEYLDAIAEATVDTNDAPIKRVDISAVSVAGPGGVPESADTAILSGVAESAGEAVKGAGQTVAAIPGKLPKARLPRLPFVGQRDKESVPPPAAADEPDVPAPAPKLAPAPAVAKPEPMPSEASEPFVAATDNRVPPEFDLLQDEIGAAASAPEPARPSAPGVGPDEAELAADPGVPQVTEDPETKRKLLSLPVPKGKREPGEKSLMTRLIERVW